ncbi:MAG TPA: hypothetical protein VGG32_07005 [Thermoplasmata archaeon]|jgi:hypothetical protein
MSAIPREYRETITEREFLETVAKYGILCYRGGNRFFFINPNRPSDARVSPRAELVSPADVIEFVRNDLEKGEPALKFVRDKGQPDRLGLANTPAGRRRAAAIREAEERVRPPLPYRWTHRGKRRRASAS